MSEVQSQRIPLVVLPPPLQVLHDKDAVVSSCFVERENELEARLPRWIFPLEVRQVAWECEFAEVNPKPLPTLANANLGSSEWVRH